MDKLRTRQIHLDFHTPELPFELGNQFNKKKFQGQLVRAKVNSVTVTARCHHGFIYYHTALEAKHPQMKKDFLVEQIDALHEIKIKAPVYISVGWDAYMAKNHSDWLEIHEDGSYYGFEDFGQFSPGWKKLCLNSPYFDYLLVQIKDTMIHLGNKLDGLFFDITWQDPCCCNHCVKKMLALNLDPQSELERKIFAKQTEILTKQTIVKVIRQIKSDCPIFFNEGDIAPKVRKNLQDYSHFEIESLPSGAWGYQHFSTTVRYVKKLGKEYLGMTSKFHKSWADFGSYKNQVALEYETLLALFHGGKCSIGDQMYPDGHLSETTYDLIGSVYKIVEELEIYSQNSAPVSEIAILHPGIIKETSDQVDVSLAGAVNLLNELHYQFDIIDDEMDFSEYSVLILVDKIKLASELSKKINLYIEDGGKIVATFESGLNQQDEFPEFWDFIDEKANEYSPTYLINKSLDSLPNDELVMHGPARRITVGKKYRVLAVEGQPLYQRNYQHFYSHYHAPMDNETSNPLVISNGVISYATHPLFKMYKQQGVLYYKRIVKEMLTSLIPNQLIKSNLPSSADIIVNYQEKEKRLIVNVLHYIPERRSLNIDTIEERIALHHLHFEMNIAIIEKKIAHENVFIKKIMDGETKKELRFTQKNQKVYWETMLIDGYKVFVLEWM